ncbi:unnamed protein product [Vitrella brassicaformis CCMP3155]|uniref:Uncharacterized protein n=1 Tax=Vitrella brassicaformis (strain CCMP3155) TaxID=1169540 RepID=A0A0G4H6R0_VITBC|nr:unnamed protein product [Vitrella brassicaformis CCMP3155]|eukprot:CEM39534.1 unnamed protein product [Vitrella brassicaformis CCMP3155]
MSGGHGPQTGEPQDSRTIASQPDAAEALAAHARRVCAKLREIQPNYTELSDIDWDSSGTGGFLCEFRPPAGGQAVVREVDLTNLPVVPFVSEEGWREVVHQRFERATNEVLDAIQRRRVNFTARPPAPSPALAYQRASGPLRRPRSIHPRRTNHRLLRPKQAISRDMMWIEVLADKESASVKADDGERDGAQHCEKARRGQTGDAVPASCEPSPPRPPPPADDRISGDGPLTHTEDRHTLPSPPADGGGASTEQRSVGAPADKSGPGPERGDQPAAVAAAAGEQPSDERGEVAARHDTALMPTGACEEGGDNDRSSVGGGAGGGVSEEPQYQVFDPPTALQFGVPDGMDEGQYRDAVWRAMRVCTLGSSAPIESRYEKVRNKAEKWVHHVLRQSSEPPAVVLPVRLAEEDQRRRAK